MNRLIFCLPFLFLAAQPSCAQDAAREGVAEVVKPLLEANQGKFAVEGADKGWWFPVGELQHLAHDRFWEKWEALGKPDPVPVIAKYAAEVKERGAELLVVFVPSKAALYPEKLSASGARPVSMLPFLKKLNDAGVKVLDLEKILAEARDGGMQVYCRTDSHWTPEAGQLVAKKIAEGYRGAPWIGDPKGWTRGKPRELEVHGDLVPDELKATTAKEKLTLVAAGPVVEGQDAPGLAKGDPDSPVLLLGDSHTIVFSIGGDPWHAAGCGVYDHLSAEFGLALDRSFNPGNGSGVARVNLARRAKKDPSLWEKKKLVIWLLTARELTGQTWRAIPAQP